MSNILHDYIFRNPCIILLTYFPLFEQKLYFRAECKKEIEEAIASISKKYNLKLHEVEVEEIYLFNLNELDMNQIKILIHRNQ